MLISRTKEAVGIQRKSETATQNCIPSKAGDRTVDRLLMPTSIQRLLGLSLGVDLGKEVCCHAR